MTLLESWSSSEHTDDTVIVQSIKRKHVIVIKKGGLGMVQGPFSKVHPISVLCMVDLSFD